MIKSKGNYTLITGGAKGIGYEIAKRFAKEGSNILLVARDIERLVEVKNEFSKFNIKVEILKIDISKDNEIESMFKYIKENEIEIENIINNAGVGSFGEFKDTNNENNDDLIKININALTKITRCFLPQLLEKNRGGILNIASTAAFCAGPKMGIYYASKAYVLNLTEAIHEECRGSNVKISCLCPGPVKTEFQNKAGIVKTEAAKKYLMDAKIVANIGYEGFIKGKVIIIPGFKNKLLVLGNKFLPRVISRRIINSINQ